jgi:hypothetical protein
MLKHLPRVSALTIAVSIVLLVNPTISNSSSFNSQSEVSSVKPLPEKNVFEAKIKAKKDDRAKILGKFLKSKNSPMTQDADRLVEIADKYNLNWRLLPAIAGVESHYGRAIPQGSYNPYGWNNGEAYFKDWAQASEVVASGIRVRYSPTGVVTPHKIGPNYAANPSWANHVAIYMNQIDQI